MTNTVFILGREPQLSVAEIAAVLGPRAAWAQAQYSREALVVPLPGEVDAAALMARLGGTVKVGEMTNDEFRIPNSDEIVEIVRLYASPEGKIRFGISVYDCGAGAAKARALRKSIEAIAHEVKRALVATTGRSVRWVTSRDPQLSSVVVAKEGLTPKGGGVEVLVLATPEGCMLGRTLAVQPFADWGERDFGKPQRSMARGMLPPKLARMMVNVAISNLKSQISNPIVLDPFCGTGTVLLEALALGCRAMGSDNDPQAIAAARANLAWYRERHPEVAMPELRVARAEDLAAVLPPASVDAIVTEPTLGPTRGAMRANALVRDLRQLYIAAFHAFARIVKSGGRVVFITPMFSQGRRTTAVEIVRDVEQLGFHAVTAVPPQLRMHPLFGDTHGLSYARPGARVGRRILVFERM